MENRNYKICYKQLIPSFSLYLHRFKSERNEEQRIYADKSGCKTIRSVTICLRVLD